MNGGGSSVFSKAEFCQGLPNYPPFHIPSNVNGNFSQGSILPNPGIAHIQGQSPFPVYSHNSQIPVFPPNYRVANFSQVPQYFSGVWNPATNATPWHNLLQQVMNGGSQINTKDPPR